MTATRTATHRRSAVAVLLAAVLVLAALLGVGAVGGGPAPVRSTEAGYASAEHATLTASAGSVQPAGTVCTPASGSPHQLALTPPADGLTITGYRVTITVDPVPSGGYGWQAGTKDGIELLPIGESHWPATQTVVGWGIELPMLAGDDFYGTVAVAAVGPGGWESATVDYDWAIESDWGFTTSTCTPVAG